MRLVDVTLVAPVSRKKRLNTLETLRAVSGELSSAYLLSVLRNPIAVEVSTVSGRVAMTEISLLSFHLLDCGSKGYPSLEYASGSAGLPMLCVLVTLSLCLRH